MAYYLFLFLLKCTQPENLIGSCQYGNKSKAFGSDHKPASRRVRTQSSKMCKIMLHASQGTANNGPAWDRQ